MRPLRPDPERNAPVHRLHHVPPDSVLSPTILPERLAIMLPDTQTQTAIEAAAFRRLLQHLREHPEIQNVDLMITADFCRNCLAKWLLAAAQEKGLDMDEATARELVYGEPYEQWKAKFQREASPAQLAALNHRQTSPSER